MWRHVSWWIFADVSEENSASNFKTGKGRNANVKVSEFIRYYTASHPRKNHNLSVFPVPCYSNCVIVLSLHSPFFSPVNLSLSRCISYFFLPILSLYFFVHGPSPYWHFLLLTSPFHPTIFMSLFLTSIHCETRHDLSRLPPAFQIRPCPS